MATRQLPLISDESTTALTQQDLATIRTYERARYGDGAAKSTVAAEVSQLRSMARSSQDSFHMGSLKELCRDPMRAARLIEESAGAGLSRATVMTRVRAFQRLLMMELDDGQARSAIARFRAGFPNRPARGWHDSGVDFPGNQRQSLVPGPTPGPRDIERIVLAAASVNPGMGAVVAVVCFSALDVEMIVTLKWTDLIWRDSGLTPFWEVVRRNRGHETHYYIVGPGSSLLLRWGLASGLQRDSYVFPGRNQSTPISVRGFRYKLKAACSLAGWPGVTRSQLASALAMWLREQGLDDHSIRLTLGRRRVTSVDRLLRRHLQLEAQRRVDKSMESGN